MSIAALLVPGLYNRHLLTGLQTGDATAPVFASGPETGAVTDTTLSLAANITDSTPPITFYMVVVADAAGAPSAAQIKAGTDSGDTPVPNASLTASDSGSTLAPVVAGLTASTAYDVYYVAADSFDNTTTPAKADVTTAATPTYDPQDTARPISSSGSRMVRSIVSDMT